MADGFYWRNTLVALAWQKEKSRRGALRK